jgi:hypothetical protein
VPTLALNNSQAVLLYWTVSNSFTALQSRLFGVAAVRAYFGLPENQPVDPTAPKQRTRSLLAIFRDKIEETAKAAQEKTLAEAASSRALLRTKQKQAQEFQAASKRRQPTDADLYMEEEDAAKPLERVTAGFKQATAKTTQESTIRREQELLRAAKAQSEERARLEGQLKQSAQRRLKAFKPK